MTAIDTKYVGGKMDMATQEMEKANTAELQGYTESSNRHVLRSVGWSLMAIAQWLEELVSEMEEK